jgi:hypothetical protein
MPHPTPHRRRLGSGAKAGLLLAATGFAGGLVLAVCSFNGSSSEAPIRVGALAPEVIYVAPDSATASVGGEASADAAESASADATLSLSTVHGQPVAPEAIFPDEASNLDPMYFNFVPEFASSTLMAASAAPGGWSALGNVSAVPIAAAAGTGAGWGAVSLPAVPEPSTWALLIGGLAVVGAAVRRRLRA